MSGRAASPYFRVPFLERAQTRSAFGADISFPHLTSPCGRGTCLRTFVQAPSVHRERCNTVAETNRKVSGPCPARTSRPAWRAIVSSHCSSWPIIQQLCCLRSTDLLDVWALPDSNPDSRSRCRTLRRTQPPNRDLRQLRSRDALGRIRPRASSRLSPSVMPPGTSAGFVRGPGLLIPLPPGEVR